MNLRTRRLILRPLAEGDAGAMVAGLNEWDVTRYLTRVQYPYTEADARSWIASQRPPQPRDSTFAIELPGRGMIGSVGIGDQLGYWLDLRFHGQGYMTEACVAVLDWRFAALPDDIVRSGAHVGNEASLSVQRKLGFIDSGARSMRFVRSQNRDVEHIETTLWCVDYEAARRRLVSVDR